MKRLALGLCAYIVLITVFTIYANVKVEITTCHRIYSDIDSIPYNKVGLLLGTSPLNRSGGPNTYFTNRINIAAELYHAGKLDFIIASGDNHIVEYDESSAMRDSLIAHGVPDDRIILDFAGFRTLDSVVRAKEIFDCDSLTIVSQADHNARALYLAKVNGIDAVALSAPLKAGLWVRTRLAIREWLTRDKMMLDIWFGKQPHFLGDKTEIPSALCQKSYSTTDEMTVKIINPTVACTPLDSIVVEFVNHRDMMGTTGEWFRIDQLTKEGKWQQAPYSKKFLELLAQNIDICFNGLGYGVSSGETLNMTYKPWFYDLEVPGRYRLVTTYNYPPYPNLRSDTAYVEFELR